MRAWRMILYILIVFIICVVLSPLILLIFFTTLVFSPLVIGILIVLLILSAIGGGFAYKKDKEMSSQKSE